MFSSWNFPSKLSRFYSIYVSYEIPKRMMSRVGYNWLNRQIDWLSLEYTNVCLWPELNRCLTWKNRRIRWNFSKISLSTFDYRLLWLSYFLRILDQPLLASAAHIIWYTWSPAHSVYFRAAKCVFFFTP